MAISLMLLRLVCAREEINSCAAAVVVVAARFMSLSL